MNIFVFDKSPVVSAEQAIDKHIVKMPTESCQMLHTNALYFHYKEIYEVEPSLKDLKEFHSHINSNLMKPAMLNHPSTIWARETPQNFLWLYRHAHALCDEYTYRYGKEHGTRKRIQQTPIEMIHHMETQFPSKLTPVSIAMDDSYRLDYSEYMEANPNNSQWDFVIDSYKHYYLEGKWRFAEWRKNRMPEWWPSNWYAVKYNIGARAYNANKPKYPLTLMEE